jgi:hypothetical protein
MLFMLLSGISYHSLKINYHTLRWKASYFELVSENIMGILFEWCSEHARNVQKDERGLNCKLRGLRIDGVRLSGVEIERVWYLIYRRELAGNGHSRITVERQCAIYIPVTGVTVLHL